MASVSSNWQDSLNNKLVNRVTRPLTQPGMIKMAMSQGIINRCDRFLNRVPLLTEQMGRWGNNTTLSYDAVPIVYAQPVPLQKQQEMGTGRDNVQMSNQSKNQPSVPIIQRKEDSSLGKLVQKDNQTVAVQNLTDLSSSNFADEKISSLALETEINQSSISASEIPLISPQPISEELANSSEMPIQGKFSDSSNASELNPSISSISEETEIINQTSISQSEIPLVSPQPISEQLGNSSEMPIQGKFIDSSNASELNPNISSISEQTKIIDQTSISQSEIPLVSPQPISEQLGNSSEMPIQGKFIDSSNTSELNPNISSTSEEKKIINQTSISPSEIPLVSPQPISEELANSSEMPLQEKFTDSSNTSQLNPHISSTSEETEIINQTSISASEIPLVSPQPISEELAKTSEMPLQEKFIDSSNASELNPNISSTSEEKKIINHSSISKSEIPLVSPQPISEELANSSEMPIQGKFIDSSNTSQLNPNISSTSEQKKIIDGTSISQSEIPLVSPQLISEKLANSSEMPLPGKFIDSSNTSELNPNISSTSEEEKIIDETSTSSSEIPLVSPQPISEELANSSEMPIQGKFIDSSNTSELNPNISSTSEQEKIIDETSTSSSEIPLVSSQPISEELANISEMPLQGKFIDSSNTSELNPNISSTSEQTKIINQTSISPSEIPLVSTQPISEKLGNSSEMPLLGKFIDSSNTSQLNPNISSTSEERKIINQTSISASEIPLVSPQPISEELANSSEMPIQGKFIDSSNTSELNQNISSTSEETKVTNQTSISTSEIPLVSSQQISEKLVNSSEMPLPGKFIDSSNTSELNSNISSTSEETKVTNQTSISTSEIPLVSPQQISEKLVNSSEMPLPGKFIDSSNTSELNPNISLNLDKQEKQRINQTSISAKEIPVVSPQIVPEELGKTSEMLLRQEFTNISEKPLPVIKAKQQNASLSPLSIPLVNPLNTSVPRKQLQQDENYSTKINSIKKKNLESQISSPKLPIVTTQPLTSPVNFAKNERAFTDEQNHQNQSFNTSKSEIKPSHNPQNNNPLTTPINPAINNNNSNLKMQPLPLYKNRPLSNSISQQPNLSNQNPIGTNTNSSSSPKIYANPSSPTQTSVSTMANQSNSKIDIDAIANKVERKLMRRLVIESERRGKSR